MGNIALPIAFMMISFRSLRLQNQQKAKPDCDHSGLEVLIHRVTCCARNRQCEQNNGHRAECSLESNCHGGLAENEDIASQGQYQHSLMLLELSLTVDTSQAVFQTEHNSQMTDSEGFQRQWFDPTIEEIVREILE
jgi:hypothetical protein